MVTDFSPITEQRLLDLRAEYPLLVSAGFSLRNMYWLGYGAFFTINTLLATTLVFSYSERSNLLGSVFLTILHFFIPVTGVFISIVAVYTSYRINRLERIVIARGMAKDKILYNRMFTSIEGHTQGFSWPTAIGSLLFLVMWAAALC